MMAMRMMGIMRMAMMRIAMMMAMMTQTHPLQSPAWSAPGSPWWCAPRCWWSRCRARSTRGRCPRSSGAGSSQRGTGISLERAQFRTSKAFFVDDKEGEASDWWGQKVSLCGLGEIGRVEIGGWGEDSEWVVKWGVWKIGSFSSSASFERLEGIASIPCDQGRKQ